jgi:hypothetical protein
MALAVANFRVLNKFIHQPSHKMKKSLILFIVLLAALVFAAVTENNQEKDALETLAINE